MRRALAIVLALMGLWVGPGGAGAWEHNAVLWNPETSPIPVYLHEAGVDELSVEDLESVLQTSFATWNEVPCATVALQYAGRTDMSVQTDDVQLLEWIEQPERWVYGSMAAGANIAFVYDDPATPEHEDPKVDIAFNGVNFAWKFGGSGSIRDVTTLDPESVLTHELGHFLGLAHTRASNAATMAPAYVPDTGQRTLSFDDKVGMCEKYWVEASECETDDDCPENSACQTWQSEVHGGAVRLCAEHHGRFGDPCSGTDLNCEAICLFSRPDFSAGTCSAPCMTDDDCPCDWSCRNLQTPDNPFLVCRDIPPDGGDRCQPDPGDDDMDAGATDTDTDTDAGPDPDADADADVDASPDAAPDDAGGGTTPPPDDGCDCTTSPNATPATWPALMLILLSALQFGRRRSWR